MKTVITYFSGYLMGMSTGLAFGGIMTAIFGEPNPKVDVVCLWVIIPLTIWIGMLHFNAD